MSRIDNCRISGTYLGIEDHGILTFFIHLDGDGCTQGYGGYACDGYKKGGKYSERFGHPFLAVSIRQILETVGCETWEGLAGKHVRVEREGSGDKILRVGHIIKNKWVSIEEIAQDLQKEGN